MTGRYLPIYSLIMVGLYVLLTALDAKHVLLMNFVHLIKEEIDMIPLIEKSTLITSLQTGGLGIIIGGIFAIFGYKPPSPDNLAGILGIVGIYVGWLLVGHFIK